MQITLEKKTGNNYPWVGFYAGWVVFFTKQNEGVILKSDNNDYLAGTKYPFYNEDRYMPWHGTITIEV